MPSIKAAGAAPQPPTGAEKELEFARQQAEIKGGETLIREVSETITKQQEKAQSARSKHEQTKDSAQLSGTHKQFSTDGTVPADQEARWTLEANEHWEAFLEWQPDPNADIQTQLQELSQLYLTLLEAALKHAEGENLAEQLEHLDSLLAQKLNLLMEQNLGQLTTVLEESGQSEALDSILSSLYRQTAGRTISPQAAHQLLARGGGAAGKPSFFLPFPASASSGEGMIYQPSGKHNVRFQQTYHTQKSSWKEQIRQRTEIIRNAQKGIAENTFQKGSPVYCSGRELERANRFAAHIDGSGNLFKNPDITAKNAEVTGLMAAVMSMKGQVYAQESRGTGTSSLSRLLQNAIEKIISQYINRKEASQVYCHTLSAYRQLKDPRKAIADGQNYAFRRFREKQEQPAYEKSPQYSKESGFFRALQKGLSPEKEFAAGVNILQKDWQNFLYAIGNRQASYHTRNDIPSPWGALGGARPHLPGWDQNLGKILMGGAATILITTLAAVWFRLL